MIFRSNYYGKSQNGGASAEAPPRVRFLCRGKTLLSVSEIVSLYADMELDTYSVWLRGISTAQMWARQEKYFALNGKNTPDYIFFDEYTPYDIALDGYEVFDRGKYNLLVKSE